ncbi:cell division septation protein DedD [Pseudoxanthomonas sp. 3HH-4]|uniref:SPOR domain-containing protein n=1 Tax=Pseudoxanthomonas sp. 3HH-4 TaxID=1690214 RepID=UPI00114DB47B|nr:SPOR domain-containing protein [Pseudoxanthomonas sp. 3HH-4]TQM13081.1 cell division septation protein DedD [Pseudoxanthomonas sp. 3HH-4]
MDTALKQRLIGAVVLVALAVIFLPMLVKGPAPDSGVSDVPLDVPPAANGEFETRELPLVTPGNAPATGAVGLQGQVAAPAAEPAPATGTVQPAATAGGDFAVSFGAYATQADADAVLARVKQAKLPGFVEPATINGKPAFRVRVGPYADRPQAEAARLDAIKIRGDVNAQVVTLDVADTAPATTWPAATASVASAASTTAAVTTQALPPEPTKPAPKPAAPEAKPAATKPAPTTTTPVASTPKPAEATKPAASGTGFAVQLGAFSNAADANALRDRARGAGFSAFVEQVRTDKGTLSRVRVGPVANRADADRLKAQVASRIGVDGMVRPHP